MPASLPCLGKSRPKSVCELVDRRSCLPAFGCHYNRNFKFRPKTSRPFFFLNPTMNMIRYANKGNFWLKKYKQEFWFNFDLFHYLFLICWIWRQKCLILFGQKLVNLFVVAWAKEGLGDRTRPASSHALVRRYWLHSV